ncbi:hypothetical protein [Flavobacterium soyae]|uniref:Uncharacterized protein n=1 Tax=Flavobacterium soyae TaxID=2903098 RepID=A0ABZ2UC22_9FLAO
MKKMSDLVSGAYFSFGEEKSVYHVDRIVYSGNRNGDFIVYYYNIDTLKDFIWNTKQYNSVIYIYPN